MKKATFYAILLSAIMASTLPGYCGAVLPDALGALHIGMSEAQLRAVLADQCGYTLAVEEHAGTHTLLLVDPPTVDWLDDSAVVRFRLAEDALTEIHLAYQGNATERDLIVPQTRTLEETIHRYTQISHLIRARHGKVNSAFIQMSMDGEARHSSRSEKSAFGADEIYSTICAADAGISLSFIERYDGVDTILFHYNAPGQVQYRIFLLYHSTD